MRLCNNREQHLRLGHHLPGHVDGIGGAGKRNRGAQRLRGGAPVRNERILAVGDGMFTDIVGACDEGLDSILITSGIHRDRIRVTGPDGRFTVEPAAYAELVRESGATPTGHMAVLEW